MPMKNRGIKREEKCGLDLDQVENAYALYREVGEQAGEWVEEMAGKTTGAPPSLAHLLRCVLSLPADFKQ